MKERGLNLGEFQMKLLEKIEELTLYTEQQAKAIEDHRTEVSTIKSENADLRARLAALERVLQQPANQK